ncbi:solute carrier family 25 member 51 [Cimex lectularius]|uniref:Solute carrier family 25 member 51 n=1 Tax=Cimex lectularius TaxID=79782 RepID=A0A8I6RJR8_CIMLE|nr:solute carrier family 25 member 51 [Cimex lectularius]
MVNMVGAEPRARDKRSGLCSSPIEYKEFACGWGAASINILVTFPLNKVIFRQMLHNVTTMQAVRQITEEGVVHLYRGVLPPLVQKSLSVSIMFGVYDKCKKPLLEKNLNPIFSTIVASIAAGTIESILMPFERIQTLLQHQRYHRDVQNMKAAVKTLGKHGFSEYYRGLVPVLFRNGPSNAVFFLMRDQAKSSFPEPNTIPMRMLHQFAVGALIGAFCSTIFYPCNVLKVHMQSRVGGPFQSVPSAVREIYIERGSIRSFFRGVHLNYTRSCISWGVINVAYEGLKNFF